MPGGYRPAGGLNIVEMHQIRYFLAVCDALNFTRAAETCNVTQPALTRAIQKLGAELGGLLFRRERNLPHLTDLGGLMRPHLEQVLTRTETAKSTAVGFLKLDIAGMGISFMPEFSPALPGIMTRYVTDPDIVREVALVTIAGRRFSPAVTAFVRELKAYKWPD
jgi:DNA-binding transcriptional LysR family regulator